MGLAERIHEEAVVAGQATAKYRARGVPSDWYVDPADPDAADRYNEHTKDTLQDQATELEQQTEEAQTLMEELEQTNEQLQQALHDAEDARDAAHAAEQSATRAADQAAEANRVKADFLRVMSHELRTPLNAIGGYAQLLEGGVYGPLADQQREALGRIERSQRHLLSLINDVLNFARLEAGRVEISLAPVPVHEVMLELEMLVGPQLRAKELDYVVAHASDTAADSVNARNAEPIPEALIVYADQEKLLQILLNLLTNAIKFTPAGGKITVGAHSNDGTVAIWVRDTGIGIPADKLETVFEPFVQIGREPGSAHEGTGLGLAICRDLARAMGGKLDVRSEVGAGSTFTLILPRADRERASGA